MREEVTKWWKQSKADLDTAKSNFENEKYYAAVFFSQQAAEKALKALHIKEFKSFPKVHDLVFLSEKLGLPENITEKCDALSKVYTETRYPDLPGDIPSEKFSVENSIEFVKMAEEVLKWLEKKL